MASFQISIKFVFISKLIRLETKVTPTSSGWWAASVAIYCPGRMVEHPTSKSLRRFKQPHGSPYTSNIFGCGRDLLREDILLHVAYVRCRCTGCLSVVGGADIINSSIY